MVLAGGFGLRNTIIIFAVFNLVIVLIAAIINNLFPNIPFAEIITAYVNVFLTSVLLFLAGTVGFAEIVFNVGFAALWALFNFLWTLLDLGESPDFLKTAPIFNFSQLTAIFVNVFIQILDQPLIFTPPVPMPTSVSLATGGAITTAVFTQPSFEEPEEFTRLQDLTPEQQALLRNP